MSGTSADAIDAALVDLSSKQINILGTHSQPLSENIRSTIHRLAVSGSDEIEAMRVLDYEIASHTCNVIQTLCEQNNVGSTDICAIGNHGQTIRHYPKTTDANGYSLQIGDPNIIAERTGITTVSDFRRRDIAAHGQGAPLTPAFHNAVFRSKDKHRIIVNLGGIANITTLNENPVIGYDTGPANGLLDSWCQQHRQEPYDNHGNWAKTGTLNTDFLKQLQQHPFFSLTPPKSTGREDFNLPWLLNTLQQHSNTLAPEDVQATLLELTVTSLVTEISKQDPKEQAEVYICGGGAHNTHLMSLLSQALTPRKVDTTEYLGIHPSWVEATAFAWLAKQTLNKATGNLPSVTGADREVILGGIYLAH